MHLTIIEPHHHFGVLKHWVQVCIRTIWHVQIISSKANWDKLLECIPEECSACSFYAISELHTLPKTDLLIFTSAQTRWRKWNPYAHAHPSALLIHNGNMFFNPSQNIASLPDTGFSNFKYATKWIYEKTFNQHIRKKFIRSIDYIIPYSSTQLDYFTTHSPHPVLLMPISFRQEISGKKKPEVVLYLYNRFAQIDEAYFKNCLNTYQSEDFRVIHVICTMEEYQLLPTYLKQESKVKWHSYPMPPSNYYDLLRSSQYVCLPFIQDRVFNIFKEKIGLTKYSGRIRDALEYGCEIHMPEYIPQENTQLPTLDEAAEEMGRKLNEMYQNAHS